jgi:hypothetical protein
VYIQALQSSAAPGALIQPKLRSDPESRLAVLLGVHAAAKNGHSRLVTFGRLKKLRPSWRPNCMSAFWWPEWADHQYFDEGEWRRTVTSNRTNNQIGKQAVEFAWVMHS